MNTRDYFSMSRVLEQHHTVLYKMWELGEPVWDEKIDTACVKFNRKTGRKLSYHFNPTFWDSLDEYTRAFVISHECIHVLNSHGLRMRDMQPDLANIALDIAVNESLFNYFGFEQEKMCMDDVWSASVLEKYLRDKGQDITVPKDASAEYYYQLIIENAVPVNVGVMVGEPVQGEEEGETLSKELTEYLQRMLGEELQEAEAKSRGETAANAVAKFKYRPRPKRKWETVIKNWCLKSSLDFVTEEQWLRENRRMACFKKDILLPTELDLEDKFKNKIDVWFYQDTSGSCAHLAERFFKAALSVPTFRFNVRAFCFDTEIYEVDLKKGELFGFGGTAFSIIEDHIQKEMTTGKKYPSAVFVITDGAGDNVNPEHPKRWNWFLSENNKSCIPAKCNTFMLENFE